MPDQLPLHRIVALAIGALPLTSAIACPYMSSGHDSSTHRDYILDKRAAAPSGACPRKPNVAGGGTRSRDFWPCQLRLDVLRQNSPESNPLTAGFDYAAEFSKLDVDQLKKDMTALQTTSQSWWPADYGDYGPLFVRLAWHSAGTYRQMDGRGGSGMGQQRFAPLNGWADNANLDKARRLLWPIKQKYGSALSWADLFAFAGNTALENMGLPTCGFAFGRVDTWQADESVFWGDETDMFPSRKSDLERYDGSTDIHARASRLDGSLANTNMGLIYVDPMGPHGIPDPKASARDIRTTFGRMGMDDEETVALIAGGHAFGKAHGAVGHASVGPNPNAADIAMQGLGWHNSFNTGFANNTFTTGLEVIWSPTPTKWSNHFLETLFQNNFTLVTSPAGFPQWEAQSADAVFPDPFRGPPRKPTMMTSDLALINDPVFLDISHTYLRNFDYFTTKFSKSWFKLLHLDMGPLSRYLGPYVPTTPPFLWQDPLPAAHRHTITNSHVATLKSSILSTPGLNVSNLITTAWGSASSFRISDKRGGANGARIALAPQSSWTCNNPPRLSAVLAALRQVRAAFNAANPTTPVSLADLIVIGGNAAIESAAALAGHPPFTVPFAPGRVDASQDDTDPASFAFLEGRADGFRNCGVGNPRGLTEELLVDNAALLALSPPELTVLVGGIRALDANFDGSAYGVLTSRPGRLTNDFFVNLLDMSTVWKPVANTSEEVFVGTDSDTGRTQYTAKRADLVFGSHPELRAIAEVYAQDDAGDKFVKDFVAAWVKVSELDRFDLRKKPGGFDSIRRRARRLS